ncbi:hypothetical protein O181_029480 [Austropuccinia psidii MF-1]|uniref:Uncharacterized protein n=1 Tax=Austropuccinia psidii MF-1 TaxID=1389203 RepID=A0A9Q3CUI5_9BASI|nr:hypothetical protein [Austropuccinia psidii MF-1]
MPPTPPSHQPNPQCCLPSLHSCSNLKMRPQCLPHLHPHQSLGFHTPPLTILTFPRCPHNMPPKPPSTPLTPPSIHPILSAAYHAYTHVLDS